MQRRKPFGPQSFIPDLSTIYRPKLTGVLLVLTVVLLSITGCASAPDSTEQIEPSARTEARSESEISSDTETEPVIKTVYLPSLELSYFADGTLDTRRSYTYQPGGTGLLRYENHDATGRVIERDEYVLEKDLPVERRSYNEKQELKTIRRYSHDPRGNLVSEETFDAADTFLLRSEYTYDENNRRTEIRITSSFAGAMGTTRYHYENGLPVRIESVSPSGDLEEYIALEYDSTERPVTRTRYDARGRVQDYTEYEYPEQNMSRETVYRAGGAVVRSAEYEHDETGNVKTIVHRDREGNVRERIEIEYVTRDVHVE
jgi:YD repeat-containing protein